MTIGQTIDMIIDSIENAVNKLLEILSIEELLDNDIVGTIVKLPGKMARSFTELFSTDYWGWIFAVVFCVVSLILLWKSMTDVMSVLTKALLCVVIVVLVASIIWCILNGSLDIAILMVMLLIVMHVMKHFFPKPPEEKK